MMNIEIRQYTLPAHPKVLVIHPALAPYRLDIFNALSMMSELKLALLKPNCVSQEFDQKELLSKLSVEPVFLSKRLTIIGRDIPSGIGALVKQASPDIVFTSEFSVTTLYIALFNLTRKEKFRHVIWTDDNPESIKRDGVLHRLGRRLLSRQADGWIFVSGEIQSHYENVFGVKKPSAVLPVIHDEEVFRNQLVRSGQFFEKIVADNGLAGKRVLLYVGRLVALKGIDLLLRAYQKVVAQLDNTLLVIVGDGEEKEALALLVTELGIEEHVRFVGRYEGEELAVWYRASQVFALASHFEPFGAVVNEALICGLPAVVSNHAGARTLIDEGVNGSVVDSEDVDQFSGELIKWLAKADPLDIDGAIKSNLMSVKFSEVVTDFAGFISTLMVKR